MKVLILKGAVGPTGLYKKGTELELADDVATQLIKDGIAEAIAEKPSKRAERADSIQSKKRNKR